MVSISFQRGPMTLGGLRRDYHGSLTTFGAAKARLHPHCGFPTPLATDGPLLSVSLELLEHLKCLPLRWHLHGFALLAFNRLILSP